MSCPFRPVSLLLVVLALGFAGCRTSTPYTRMYSPRRNYFVPPPVKPDKSAEELIKATEPPPGGAPAPGLPGGLPPSGLPGELPPPAPAIPAPAPPVDPLATPPAAPPL